MATINIIVKGMHCASCKGLIEDVSGDVPGVITCTVDAKTGRGVIEHDERFQFSELEKAITELGEYTIARV
jgi:copper chaperone CopZ